MAEGKVDNRGSAFGSDAQPDPPQIPVAEASQQDTVWRCFAVCGLRGFPSDLPDTPHLLTKKNDLRFGSKGSCAPRCHLASDARALPIRQRKRRCEITIISFSRSICRGGLAALIGVTGKPYPSGLSCPSHPIRPCGAPSPRGEGP